MSMLRVVARRAIHQYKNETVAIASARSHSHRANARCGSQLLHTVPTRAQSNDTRCTAATQHLSTSRQIHSTHHVSIADSFPQFRYSPLELPHLQSGGGRRYFSSPAPQKETQHVSSVIGDDLQIDKSDKDGSAVYSPGAVPSDEQTNKASKSELEEPKPKVVQKKESTIIKKATDLTTWAIKSLVALLAKTPGVLWFYMTHPAEFRKKLGELKEMAVKEAHHYWMGSKVGYSRLSVSWYSYLSSAI